APGVEVWEVPAPPGGTRLVVAPADPRAGCGPWREALAEADVTGAGQARAHPGYARDDGSSCVLPPLAPLSLELRRAAPAPGSIALRAGWAAGLLALPALLWLLWLAAEPRSRLTRARLADATALAAISIALSGLACLRVLWAHRIDAMRALEPLGWRSEDNLLWIGLAAAALAATAAWRAGAAPPPSRRVRLVHRRRPRPRRDRRARPVGPRPRGDCRVPRHRPRPGARRRPRRPGARRPLAGAPRAPGRSRARAVGAALA